MSTLISWTDETWNPVTGCSKLSPGCTFCYAEAMSHRFKRTTLPWAEKHAAENVVLHPDRLEKPYSWRRPRKVFVCSVSDLFHEEVPHDFLKKVFRVMCDLPQHTWQILTKRTKRMREFSEWWMMQETDPLPDHIWLGTSIENPDAAQERLPHLVRTICRGPRFISAEPLLGSVDVAPWLQWSRCRVCDARGPRETWAEYRGVLTCGACLRQGQVTCSLEPTPIDWVIVGGESGGHMSRHPERWMDHAWARAIRDSCLASGTAFFFKQSSGPRTEMGTALVEADGSRWMWRQYPGELVPPVRVEG